MRIRILANVKHNQEVLEIGKTYNLEDEVAQPIVDSGAAEVVDNKKKKEEEEEDSQNNES